MKAVRVNSLPRALATYLFLLVSLWALSLLDASRHAMFGSGDGFGRILLIHPGFDTLCYIDRFPFLHHAEFFTFQGFPWSYPAPCAFVYRFLYLVRDPRHFGTSSVVALFLVAIVSLCIACGMFRRKLCERGLSRRRAFYYVLGAALLSWPIYFAIERGNIEAILWFGLAFAMFAYVRRRWMLAAVVLGIMAAFKIYPILCFALFLSARKYREIVVGMLAGAVTTLLGLLYVGPNLSIAGIETMRGVQGFVKKYSLVYDPVVIGYDHSAFTLVKMLSVRHPELLVHYLPRYMAIAGLLALLLFFGRAWRMPRPNQLLMLSVMIVLLPSTSFDYTLEGLYIPWAWLSLCLVTAHSNGKKIAGAMPVMICFALLLGPETFLHFHGVLFAGQVKAVILLVMVGLSLTFPFEEEREPSLIAAA